MLAAYARQRTAYIDVDFPPHMVSIDPTLRGLSRAKLREIFYEKSAAQSLAASAWWHRGLSSSASPGSAGLSSSSAPGAAPPRVFSVSAPPLSFLPSSETGMKKFCHSLFLKMGLPADLQMKFNQSSI